MSHCWTRATVVARRRTVCPRRHYGSLVGAIDPPPLYSHSELNKAKPVSPSFYTSKERYHDNVNRLEDIFGQLKFTMKTMQLLPVPNAVKQYLPPAKPAWRQKDDIASQVGARLTTAKYRRLVNVLNDMDELRKVARVSGAEHLEGALDSVLADFELDDKEEHSKLGKRKEVPFDKYGRTYTLGKRKTSSARVWIIPTKVPRFMEREEESSPVLTEPLAVATADDVTLSQPPSSIIETLPIEPATPTQILINSVPLNHYFAQPRDHERITRPLRLAGLLGAYNIFAIVRGGGKSGQSGAVAHGIAKGLVAHVKARQKELEKEGPQANASTVEKILKKAKLIRRDPRMVERKKTGLAKARKAYQWVKR